MILTILEGGSSDSILGRLFRLPSSKFFIITHSLGAILAGFYSIPLGGYGLLEPTCCGPVDSWSRFLSSQLLSVLRWDRPALMLSSRTRDQVREMLYRSIPSMDITQGVLTHSDFIYKNILFGLTPPSVTGVIDFEYATSGDPARCIARHLVSLYTNFGIPDYREAFLLGCGSVRSLPDDLNERMSYYRLAELIRLRNRILTGKISFPTHRLRRMLSSAANEIDALRSQR